MIQPEYEWYNLMKIMRRIDDVTADIYIILQRGGEQKFYLPAFKRIHAAEDPVEAVAAAERLAWDILGGGGLQEDFPAYTSINDIVRDVDQALSES